MQLLLLGTSSGTGLSLAELAFLSFGEGTAGVPDSGIALCLLPRGPQLLIFNIRIQYCVLNIESMHERM